MNGSRSTYMRKGYLLTALAAAVLLAASSGTAYAQRVTIGFVGTNGEISERAYLDPATEADPQKVTVRVMGLATGPNRAGDLGSSLGTVKIEANKYVNLAIANTTGGYDEIEPSPVFARRTATEAGSHGVFTLRDGTADDASLFNFADEIDLFVAQSDAGEKDDNWLGEKIELQLEVSGTASVSPDIFTVQVVDHDTAPVVKFLQPDFTLSEQSTRLVELDIQAARGASLPAGADEDANTISIRVSNTSTVTFADTCPEKGDSLYNVRRYRIDFNDSVDGVQAAGWTAITDATEDDFRNTGLMTTLAESNIAGLLGDEAVARFTVSGCGDGIGIANPRIMLTIVPGAGLVEPRPSRGNITIGPPLTISVDSNEAAPTLSFSPTDVTIDEGGSVSSVLLAEGPNTNAVKMVKLSIEGDAMVSLMQDGEMLEEMDGHVYVDLGGNSSVRLTAMSHSDPDLMDGDTAFKAWKLMDDSAEGVEIGDDYWFRVDVVGSTAVPALPLLGQLLLALFLMAGGARLYRRRQG